MRWIIKGIAFVLLIATTCTALIFLLPGNQNSYFSALIDKHAILESTASPRVIVIGGSNIAFGLDSVLLTKRINKPVINLGLHAGLGLRFILNDLIPFVRAGDIVVISSEYENFYNNYLEGDNHTIASLLEVYPQASRSFEVPQYLRLTEIFTNNLRIKFLRFATSQINQSARGESEPEKFQYSRDGFNQHGDVVSHLKMPPLPNINSNPYINENDTFNPTSITVINRFTKQAREKGAIVYFIFPATRHSNCIASLPYFNDLDMLLREKIDVPILSHPNESCFADELFFNTKYHLNAEGRQLFTLFWASKLINQGIRD